MAEQPDIARELKQVVVDPDEYARLSPALLAVYASQRAAGEMIAAYRGDLSRWWFAITDVHQALTAALVAALSGTDSLGALVAKDAKAWRKYFEDSRNDPEAKAPDEGFIAWFDVLLDRAQDPSNKNDMHGTLALSAVQRKDLTRLNDYRNDLNHVKDRDWSLQTAGLPRIIGVAADALAQLFAMESLGHALEPNYLKQGKEAVELMLRLAGERPSTPP